MTELRIVRAISDAGSLTAAATALGYSQPAVSQQIKRLEHRLGVPVVERVGRRMRLTEAGRVIARHAAAVATAIDAASGELAQLAGLRAGTVRMVGFPSASPTVLPRLMDRLASAEPGLTLTYVEAEPPEAIADVRADRADIALTFGYPGDRSDPHGDNARGLDAELIGHDELLAVLPAHHRAARGRGPIDIAPLAGESWIAGCPRCRGHLLEVCGRAGFVPSIRFETDNFVAVEQLVAQGIGVATLPGLAVASFPLLPGVVTRPLPSSERRAIHAVSAGGAGRVPAVASVLGHLRSVVAGLTGGTAREN
ncbi:LysR family transcriptional regulator [Microbacterium radiodurans]|uniref:LysR family transcriptional regulator n=1 Tax=Microbacterium radiodurans TaxID=661398 RepID=UPI00295F3EAE|nr:LysR family transcriptional regulator [Microbacterium radiodurans]